MLRKECFLVLALHSCVVWCRFMYNSIAFGENAESSEFPFLGMISENGLGICAGTALTENLVLTAGHCFERSCCSMVNTSELTFHLGDVSRNPRTGGVLSSYIFLVDEIFWYDKYTCREPGKQWYDIGLLLLNEPIDFATSLHINQTLLYMGNIDFTKVACVIAGWGYNSTFHFTRKLQKAKVPIRDNEHCRKDWDLFNETLQFCAQDYHCHSGHCPDICHGDSGGPLLCPVATSGKNQTLAQVGIISGGYPPCGDSRSSYYLRIEPFLQWIMHHVKKHSKKQLLFFN